MGCRLKAGRGMIIDMKSCSRCKVKKSLSEFNKRQRAKDGLSHRCRLCQSVSHKQSYERNKQHYIDQTGRRRRKIREWIWNYKKQHSCIDCGEKRTECLDFDHLQDKRFSIASCTTISMEKLEREIKKCEVVCANCHRMRTASRKKKLMIKTKNTM